MTKNLNLNNEKFQAVDNSKNKTDNNINLISNNISNDEKNNNNEYNSFNSIKKKTNGKKNLSFLFDEKDSINKIDDNNQFNNENSDNKEKSNMPLKKFTLINEDFLELKNIKKKGEKKYNLPFTKEINEKFSHSSSKTDETFLFTKKNNEDTLGENKNYSIISKQNSTKINSLSKKKLFKPLNLGIDTESINELYLFGGDKQESNIDEDKKKSNFQDKIRLLAKHCVDYMQENKYSNSINISKCSEEVNCEFFRSDILFKDKEVDILEINESLNKFKSTKINLLDISTIDNVYDKFSNDNSLKEKEIKIFDDLNKNLFNLETKKNVYNSFSSKAPLPTSKNKQSQNFCFGKKLDLKTFPNDNFTNNLNETSNNICDTNKNERTDKDTINIPDNKTDTLILPKNKKSFLKNKKPNSKKI